jgi:hypothetical protein
MVPATATDFHCNVAVTDAAGVTSSSVTVQITVPILFVAATLTAGQQGQTGYSASLTSYVKGGSGSYTFTGMLPSGLSLAANGSISGNIPLSAPTSLTLTAQVTDSAGATSTSQTFTIPVTQTVQVSVDSLTPSATQIEQGQQPLTLTAAVSGDPSQAGVTFTLICSPSPCGSATTTSNFTATYTPPSGPLAASFNVTVTATSKTDTTKSKSVMIGVLPALAVAPPAASGLVASIGNPYNLTLQTITGTGLGSVTWSETTGNLAKVGLQLSSSGLISASQVPGGATTQQINLQATDSAGIMANLPVTITVPVKIVTTSLPPGEQAQASYSATLTAQGGSGGYTWTNSGAPPASLTVSPAGTIAGSVAANASSQTFTVQVSDTTNANNLASQALTLTINPAVSIAEPSQQSLAATIGNGFNLQLATNTGTGVAPFTWGHGNSTLPAWLSLSSSGMLSATQVPTSALTSTFTVQVTDGAGVTVSLPLTLTVPVVITTASLPSGEQTQASYSASVAAEGGSGAYTFTISSGSMPAGLILGANGSISGSPAANATTQTFTVQAADATNASTTQQFTITINSQVAITAPSAQSLTANIGGGFNLQLSTNAGTGVAPLTWTLANGSILPVWLSLSPGGVLSATSVPTSAIDSQFTVKVTDGANVTASLPLTLTVPIKITTASLPAAEQTQASYSAALAAQGGSGTYSFTISTGSLPAGLTLAANGSISGTPAANAATQMFTVQATDTANAIATQQFTISINPQVAIVAPSPQSLTAAIGGGFNLQLSTSAGTGVSPFTWAVASGSTLPAWLTFSPSGLLSATSVPITALTSQFTVQVTDAANVTASLPLNLTVPIKITNTSLPAAEQTQASYSATLAAQGGSGTYSFTISTGSLPAGLTLAASGSISGTPSANAATQTFTVQATDTTNTSATQQFTININPQVAIAAPSPQSLTAAIGATNFSLQLATTANTGVGPFTWSVANGSTLPVWLTLSPSGLLSATSVPTTANTATFTVQVTDAANVTNTLPLTLTVPIKVVTPATLPTGEQTQASYSTTLAAQGGTGTYSWVASQGSLPAGLNLATNGSISGSPAGNATSQTFTVTVTDSGTGTQQQQFTIAINPQVAIAPPSAQSLSAAIGPNPFSLQLTTVGAGTQTPSGIGPFTFSLANGSTLPTWLSLSSAGVLSAAQVPNTANTAQFTVQVKDSVNVTNSLALTITVPINILSTNLSVGEVSLPYTNSPLMAQGGSGTYTWGATGLPAWAMITAATGVISGSTPVQGSSTVTITATDSLQAAASTQLTLTIDAQVAISSATLPGGTLNAAYPATTLSATGGVPPYSNWVVSNGSLPAGLSLDKNSGTISGTPACPVSTAAFSVTVQDFLNVTSASQQFSIATVGAPLTINTTSLPGDIIGTAYSQQLQASGGGCGSITWSVAAGSSLPGWLQLSPSGLLSGTPAPTDAGTANFTLQVTDGTTTVMQSYSILVGGGFNVSGTVSLVNGGGALQGAVVSLGTGLSATTDSSGNFTIAHALAGSYSVTLGFPSAPSSAFYPASTNITDTNGTFTINVSNADVTGVNFTAGLGYKVSGKVHYHGSHNHGGQVFLSLLNAACPSCPAIQGTSLLPFEDAVLANGTHEFFDLPFVINGVPPGTYTLQGFMDYARYGLQNAYDPAGATPVTVSIASGNVTNASVTLLDPTAAGDVLFTGAWGPSSLKFSPMDNGVIIQYQPIIKNGVEQALFYSLQWVSGDQGTGACQQTPDGGFTILPNFSSPIAAGSGRIVILDFNSPTGGPVAGAPDFMDGSQTFLCMRATSIAPSGLPTDTEFQFFNGITPITIGTPAAAPGTNTVSGTVAIPAAVQPTGPLYAGCYDLNSGKMFIDPSNEGPVPGGNPYSVSGVPTGDSCFIFAMMDQNNDGFITPSNSTTYINEAGGIPPVGDIYNINQPNPTVVQITGNTTQDVDLTPFANNSNAVVMTDHIQAVDLSGNPEEGYNLNIAVTPLMGVPVEATLLSGPNAVTPVDLAICTTCGGEQSQFNVSLSTNGIRPQLGDAYVVQITYNDTSQLPDVLTLTVTGVSDAFATSFTPTGSVAGMTTPTFSWTDPSNPTNYIYQFLLSDSSGNTIWQIPGVNSFFSSFPSSITSIPWSTTKDPTGAKNPPSVASLTSGTTYTWSISVQDSNGNTAIKQVAFQP